MGSLPVVETVLEVSEGLQNQEAKIGSRRPIPRQPAVKTLTPLTKQVIHHVQETTPTRNIDLDIALAIEKAHNSLSVQPIIDQIYHKIYGEPSVNPNFEQSYSNFGNMDEEQWSHHGEHQEENHQEQNKEHGEATFGFPITNKIRDVIMKNINPSVLPQFHGMEMEDPDAFLFEFDIWCRSYNYTIHVHKLKLFIATLNDHALRWFMGLLDDSITTWDDMKSYFLHKYHDYCKDINTKEDIITM